MTTDAKKKRNPQTKFKPAQRQLAVLWLVIQRGSIPMAELRKKAGMYTRELAPKQSQHKDLTPDVEALESLGLVERTKVGRSWTVAKVEPTEKKVDLHLTWDEHRVLQRLRDIRQQPVPSPFEIKKSHGTGKDEGTSPRKLVQLLTVIRAAEEWSRSRDIRALATATGLSEYVVSGLVRQVTEIGDVVDGFPDIFVRYRSRDYHAPLPANPGNPDMSYSPQAPVAGQRLSYEFGEADPALSTLEDVGLYHFYLFPYTRKEVNERLRLIREVGSQLSESDLKVLREAERKLKDWRSMLPKAGPRKLDGPEEH